MAVVTRTVRATWSYIFQLVCTCAVPTHQTLFPWEGVQVAPCVCSSEVRVGELRDLYSQHSSDCSSHCHLSARVCASFKKKGLEGLHWVRIRGRHRAPSLHLECLCVCKRSHCQATKEYWVSINISGTRIPSKYALQSTKISWLCCEAHWALLYSSFRIYAQTVN